MIMLMFIAVFHAGDRYSSSFSKFVIILSLNEYYDYTELRIVLGIYTLVRI